MSTHAGKATYISDFDANEVLSDVVLVGRALDDEHFLHLVVLCLPI